MGSASSDRHPSSLLSYAAIRSSQTTAEYQDWRDEAQRCGVQYSEYNTVS
jgi:hypothetical protein